MNDLGQSDRTDTVAGDESFEIPSCDGPGVPLYGPGRRVRSSQLYDEISHSLSVAADHTARLCRYDHGLKVPVRIGKVAFLDFEYCFGRKPPIKSWQEEGDPTCSLGGRLNNKSASMRDLESLWKKATSFVANPEKKLGYIGKG